MNASERVNEYNEEPEECGRIRKEENEKNGSQTLRLPSARVLVVSARDPEMGQTDLAAAVFSCESLGGLVSSGTSK